VEAVPSPLLVHAVPMLRSAGPPLQEVRVLNHVTWTPLARFAHAPTITGPAALVAYSEVEEDTGRRLSTQQQV
jgi:hypothetical protein